MKITILKVDDAYVLDEEGKEKVAFGGESALTEALREVYERFHKFEPKRSNFVERKPLCDYVMPNE